MIADSIDCRQQTYLIQRAMKGDKRAYDMLITSHKAYLQSFVCHRVNSKEDAADICQETLLRAYLKLFTFRGSSTFRTWLLSIANQAIKDHYRMRDRYQAKRVALTDINEETSLLWDNSTDNVWEIHQRIRNCLNCILNTLSIEEQLAVFLCDVYGLSDRETSGIFGTSIGVFKHLLHRARTTLDLKSGEKCVLVRKIGYEHECMIGSALGNDNYLAFDGRARHASQNPNPDKDTLVSLRTRLIQGIESLLHNTH
jgi:RNA polymerase sigma-70 factor, ECF subfamily